MAEGEAVRSILMDNTMLCFRHCLLHSLHMPSGEQNGAVRGRKFLP